MIFNFCAKEALRVKVDCFPSESKSNKYKNVISKLFTGYVNVRKSNLTCALCVPNERLEVLWSFFLPVEYEICTIRSSKTGKIAILR